MTAVPAAPSIVPGPLATSTLVAVQAEVSYLLAPPIAKLTAAAAQSHNSTGNWLAVSWGAETVDSAGGHDNSTNNSRYTAVYAGWYLPCGSVLFAGNATGRRGVRYAVNGTAVNSSSVLYAATSASAVLISGKTDLIYLNVSDYIEAFAFQDSGGNLNMNTTAAPENGGFSLVWVSN